MLGHPYLFLCTVHALYTSECVHRLGMQYFKYILYASVLKPCLFCSNLEKRYTNPLGGEKKNVSEKEPQEKD